MEEKQFIRSLQEMKDLPDSVTGVYVGSEFCVTLLPSPETLAPLVKRADEKGLSFHFVTPPLTDLGLTMVRRCLDGPLQSREGCEVVANDFGLLNVLHREYPWISPVLGRLHSYQRSDPTNMEFLETMFEGEEAQQRKDLLRSVITNSEGCRAFLREMGVRRVELNNVPQGIRIAPDKEFRYTLHRPFVFVSSTRFCPTVEALRTEATGVAMIKRVQECHRECLSNHFDLKARQVKRKLFLYGNTMFYKCQRHPKIPESVDRVVVHTRPL